MSIQGTYQNLIGGLFAIANDVPRTQETNAQAVLLTEEQVLEMCNVVLALVPSDFPRQGFTQSDATWAVRTVKETLHDVAPTML